MTVIDHPAVAAYLARLDALAAHLPPARRQELRADLLEHLAEALPADADDAQVREVLDRLGPPEDIVGEEQAPPLPPPAPAGGTGTMHETLAVIFLTVGSFIPVIGWLVGLVLLLTSRKWTDGEKLAGALLVPGGPGLVASVFFLFAASTCPTFTDASGTTSGSCTPGPGGTPLQVLAVVLLVLPFVVCAVLYVRVQRRVRHGPPRQYAG